ncbi:hypothetical protein ACFOEM_07500 [Paenalcaligenes hominis]
MVVKRKTVTGGHGPHSQSGKKHVLISTDQHFVYSFIGIAL